MAQYYSRQHLSGDAYGAGINLGISNTSATNNIDTGSVIHTPGTDETAIHEIWLYANNVDATTDITVCLQWAYVNSGNRGSLMSASVAAGKGMALVIPGLLIRGRTNGHHIRGFVVGSGNINKVVIHGYANYITPTLL